MSGLTDKERLIVVHIAYGLTNKEIARRIHRTVKTVKTHRLNAMRKIGARNAADITRHVFLQMEDHERPALHAIP